MLRVEMLMKVVESTRVVRKQSWKVLRFVSLRATITEHFIRLCILPRDVRVSRMFKQQNPNRAVRSVPTHQFEQ